MIIGLTALGGALGAVLRYLIGEVALKWLHVPLPWSTLVINVLGSLLLGLLVGTGMNRHASAFLAAGLLGGFTTFSSFSVQSIAMLERAPLQALAYMAGTVFLSLAAAAAGVSAGRGS